MTDWSDPTTASPYADFPTEVGDRDLDTLLWLEGRSPTNLPTGAKRWNSTNKNWERWNGASWDPLATKYGIDVDQLDGYHASAFARVAASETISGAWNFTTAPTVGGSVVLDGGDLASAGGSIPTLGRVNDFTGGVQKQLGKDILDVGDLLSNNGTIVEEGDSPSFASATLTGNNKVLDMDGGAFILTVHDGHGHANIKAGVDENNTIVSGTGGSHIRMSDGGNIQIISYNGAEGSAASTAKTLKVDHDDVTIDGYNVPYRRSTTITLSGDYTNNDRILVEKIGRTVTITAIDNLYHSSSNIASSGIGTLPSWAQTYNGILFENLYKQDSNRVYKCYVDGTDFGTIYQDWNGGNSSTTQAAYPSITYLADTFG
jgi:hypothetical protein